MKKDFLCMSTVNFCSEQCDYCKAEELQYEEGDELKVISATIRKEEKRAEFVVEVNPYPVAWQTFIQSAPGHNLVMIMFKAGMKQPYIDNILRTAFDAGYNSK